MRALLPDKRANTYIELLRQLQQLTNNAVPADVNVDFEAGMIRALGQVYPLSSVHGCLFHLSKNVFKHVQEFGLQQMYMNDDIFRANIHMIPALSFVPVQDTVAAFDRLSQHCGNAEQAILNYFENTYVGEVRGGQRLPPIFPHVLWNVNSRVQNNLPRTNNHLEGWHTRFSNMFNYDHPSIWEFIDGLKRDNAYNHMLLAQMEAAAPPPPQKRVYMDVNTRLQTLVGRYQLPQTILFLRGISYNLARF